MHILAFFIMTLSLMALPQQRCGVKLAALLNPFRYSNKGIRTRVQNFRYGQIREKIRKGQLLTRGDASYIVELTLDRQALFVDPREHSDRTRYYEAVCERESPRSRNLRALGETQLKSLDSLNRGTIGSQSSEGGSEGVFRGTSGSHALLGVFAVGIQNVLLFFPAGPTGTREIPPFTFPDVITHVERVKEKNSEARFLRYLGITLKNGSRYLVLPGTGQARLLSENEYGHYDCAPPLSSFRNLNADRNSIAMDYTGTYGLMYRESETAPFAATIELDGNLMSRFR